jgi:hypothetical protein
VRPPEKEYGVQETNTQARRDKLNPPRRARQRFLVIPAKAGIQNGRLAMRRLPPGEEMIREIGRATAKDRRLDSRFRGNDSGGAAHIAVVILVEARREDDGVGIVVTSPTFRS